MSRTFRNERHAAYDGYADKPWQSNRGPRHGNNRKMYAKLKWQDRKIERARAKSNVESNFK